MVFPAAWINDHKIAYLRELQFQDNNIALYLVHRLHASCYASCRQQVLLRPKEVQYCYWKTYFGVFVILITVVMLQPVESQLSAECHVEAVSSQKHKVSNADDNIDELLKKILHLDSKYFCVVFSHLVCTVWWITRRLTVAYHPCLDQCRVHLTLTAF